MKPPVRPILPLLPLVALAFVGNTQTVWHVDDDAPGDPGAGNPFVSDPSEDGSTAHPFDRIQEAIDAASHQDEVRIRAGTYFDLATIDVSSGLGAAKTLWIRGIEGPALTVVDASAIDDQVMQAVSGETFATVIEGLTLTGGSANDLATPQDRGAGLRIDNSAVTLRNCAFLANDARFGGALYSNTGGIHAEDCTFTFNTALRGGAVYMNSSTGVFERCTFEGNAAAEEGGAMQLRLGGLGSAIRDSIFEGNQSGTVGGAIHAPDTGQALLIERSLFVGNAALSGGALRCGGTITLRDSLLHTNTAAPGGAAALEVLFNADLEVENVTIVNNAGLALRTDTTNVDVRNTILWANSGPQITGNPSVTYSLVLGGFPGAGNLDVDPLFLDPDGPDGIPGTRDDGFSLFASSPCIDAGDTLPIATRLGEERPLDLASNPRAVDRSDSQDTGRAVLGLTTDIGAFEFQAPCSAPRRATIQLAR